jgi:hypothetical protein
MSEDLDQLPAPERSRVTARDRKIRGPRVVTDNSGLRNIAMQVADRLRAGMRRSPAPKRPESASTTATVPRSKRKRTRP